MQILINEITYASYLLALTYVINYMIKWDVFLPTSF